MLNFIKEGIIDPAKVTRSAVQNAASIAAMILTTEALIADIPEPQSAMPPGGGRGVSWWSPLLGFGRPNRITGNNPGGTPIVTRKLAQG